MNQHCKSLITCLLFFLIISQCFLYTSASILLSRRLQQQQQQPQQYYQQQQLYQNSNLPVKRMGDFTSMIDKKEGQSLFSTITSFVTDPALLVTILHSLEVAYWTLPFGMVVKPIINLFRIPNRRMDHDVSQSSPQSVYINRETLLDAINRARQTKLPSYKQSSFE